MNKGSSGAYFERSPRLSLTFGESRSPPRTSSPNSWFENGRSQQIMNVHGEDPEGHVVVGPVAGRSVLVHFKNTRLIEMYFFTACVHIPFTLFFFFLVSCFELVSIFLFFSLLTCPFASFVIHYSFAQSLIKQHVLPTFHLLFFLHAVLCLLLPCPSLCVSFPCLLPLSTPFY